MTSHHAEAEIVHARSDHASSADRRFAERPTGAAICMTRSAVVKSGLAFFTSAQVRATGAAIVI